MPQREFDTVHRILGKLLSADPGERLVLRAGTLLTGLLSGARVLSDQAVLVEDGFISQVVPWREFAAPAGIEVIDASLGTVMPGLIEGHCHITGEFAHDPHMTHLEPFPETRVVRGLLDVWAVMDQGFTTLVSMGHGHPNHVAAIKTMVDREGLPGPRIYHPGWALSQSGGHGVVTGWNYEIVKILKPRSIFADGDGVRVAVRENIGCGADFVKIYAGEGWPIASEDVLRRLDFTDEEIRMVVDEAHRQGYRVVAHTMTFPQAHHAVSNGVDRVEHGPYKYEPEFVPMLQETGAYWCPTLSHLHWFFTERDRLGLTKEVADRMEHGLVARARMVKEALEAGVTVCFGTDNRMRPKAGQNGLEFKLLVDHGIDPLDAISMATILGARAAGLENTLGSLEPGKLADVIVVEGDPLSDISVLNDSSRITRILKSYRSAPVEGWVPKRA
jgi:imidazolonepropionase-like amidohydrolase